MYKDDQEALLARADSATREADVLRRENEAMRRAVATSPAQMQLTTLALPPGSVYNMIDIRMLPLQERARLAQHSLSSFPVWAAGLLNFLTFGLFGLIHFGIMHDKLPKAASNDPSTGKAIGFQFIPYYNLYWVFFNGLRFCDRLSLQYQVRGRTSPVPRGLILAACVCTVIPYVNLFVAIPILWTIAVCMLQACVNEISRMPTDQWDATELASAPGQGAYTLSQMVLELTPEQQAQAAKAKKLVNWSHVLGWGGLGLMFVGSIFVGIVAESAEPVMVTAGLGFVLAIAGAIVGQVGRGMQGRVL